MARCKAGSAGLPVPFGRDGDRHTFLHDVASIYPKDTKIKEKRSEGQNTPICSSDYNLLLGTFQIGAHRENRRKTRPANT